MLGISAVTSHLQLSVHLRADHLCGSALAAYPLGSVTDPFLEVCSDRAALVHHSEPLPWGPQGRGGGAPSREGSVYRPRVPGGPAYPALYGSLVLECPPSSCASMCTGQLEVFPGSALC